MLEPEGEVKVVVITMCRNEEVLMPWFLRHYERIADEIHIFDNLSDDDTAFIANRHPLVRMHQIITKGHDDRALLEIKNEYYKQLQADWFIVVDMDEFVWSPFLRGLLREYDNKGVTVVQPRGWWMIGDEVPEDDGKSLLTDHVKMGVPGPTWIYKGLDDRWLGGYDKCCVFKPSVDIRFLPGCHECRPVGDVVYAKGDPKCYLLHYKYLSLEYALGQYGGWKLSEHNKENVGTIPEETRRGFYARAKKERIQVVP